MAKKSTAKNAENIETVSEAKETTKVETKAETKPVAKQYNDTDMITCRSLIPGLLVLPGYKSGSRSVWYGIDDTCEVEYRDLQYAYTQKSEIIMEPLIVIEDEELLNQTKWQPVKRVYEKMYDIVALKNILKMSPSAMRRSAEALPKNVKSSFKNLCVELIRSGELDSVKRIKELDEVFGTELTLISELTK